MIEIETIVIIVMVLMEGMVRLLNKDLEIDKIFIIIKRWSKPHVCGMATPV